MNVLQASGVQTASGNSGPLSNHFEVLEAAILILDVTVAGSVAGDTLDAYVQHSWDEGTSFDDFVHFTQVLGNGGAKKALGYWLVYGGSPTTPMKAPQDAALAVGVQQGPVGPTWRVKWVIVNGGGSHTFTFSVNVQQWQSS